MDEFMIKSQGYSDEIISAKNEACAKSKYRKLHPKREIMDVIYNNYLG